MHNFDYHRAGSLEDAEAALKAAEDGLPLAGGMTLIPTLKQGLAMPSDLVDLGGIPDLAGVSAAGDVLSVGAMTTHATVADSEDAQRMIPALACLAAGIGDPAVRNRGTRRPIIPPPCWGWMPPSSRRGVRSPPMISSSTCSRPRSRRAS